MVEVFARKFNSLGPVSYATGSEPIDGVWVTNDLVPKEVSILLVNFRVRNHKVILVELDFD